MLMGFIDWMKGVRDSLAKEVRVFSSDNTSVTTDLPRVPNWFWTAKLGVPRNTNVVELRKYAKSAWVQMVTNAIVKQCRSTEWGVIARDEEDDSVMLKYAEDLQRIETFLSYPNRMSQTFWDVWGMFLRDLLEIDSGLVFKGRNAGGELVELFSYDAGRFLVSIDEHGIVDQYYQYSFLQPSLAPTPYDPADVVWASMNLSNHTYPYGFSPLQSIQQEVEVMIQSTRFNKEFFQNNAVPDAVVGVPMQSDQMKAFQARWEQEIKGKPHKMLFHNTTGIDVKPLNLSNKDMEWLEGQKWYFHVVFGAYGLSPQDVGFYENSNRATGESQERITIKNAVRPYLDLIEKKINREIIPELVGHDELQFRFFVNDDVAEKWEHQKRMDLLSRNVLTINEVRALEGLEPIEGGDEPRFVRQERIATENAERFNNDFKDKDEKKDEKDKKREDKGEKGVVLKEIDEVDAEDYAGFLKKKFDKWEKEVLSFVDSTLDTELEKSVVMKGFGDFIRRLFNSVNTAGFVTGLKAVIRAGLKEGMSDAEKELDVDIGLTPNFDEQVEVISRRQLDGFALDNGERWDGIKGVSRDLQNEIMELVRTGINEKRSLEEVKEDIKDAFVKCKGGERNGKITEGRAMKIARTETNRIQNLGKLQAYQESKMVKYKVWDTFFDDRTSSECKELNGQKVLVSEPFILKDGRQFMSPPAHPNCRSVIRAVLK